MVALDISVLIGTLANLVKAGELFLTEDQQKRVQKKAEDIALRLAYSRRFSVIGRFVKRNRVVVSAVSLLMSIGLTMLLGWPNWPYAPSWALLVARICGAIVSVLSLEWVLGAPKLRTVAVRGCLVSLVAVSAGAYYAITRHSVVGVSLPLLSRENVEIYLVVLGYSAALVPIIGAALWIVLDVALAICWFVARWFTWRVAVYIKGAWAALVLAGTVMLGVIDVATRHK